MATAENKEGHSKRELSDRQSPLRREQTNESPQPAHSYSRRDSPLEEDSSPSSSESESDDGDDGDGVPGLRAARFKRLGKLSMYKPSLRHDEDEDDSPAFLPLNREDPPTPHETSRQDLNATLRQNVEHRGFPGQQTAAQRPVTNRRINHNNKNTVVKSPTATESSATSSASSGVGVAPSSQMEHARRAGQVPGLLSPQRTAEFVSRGSRPSNASGRDASDGTPSMGSSFSDLDGECTEMEAIIIVLVYSSCLTFFSYIINRCEYKSIGTGRSSS